MLTHQHKNARTTPAVRAEIQRCELPDAEAARHFGVSVRTIRRWRGREGTADRSSARRKTLSVLSELQEAALAELRALDLSLDDLLEVMRRAFGEVFSRSCIWRALERLRKAGRLPSPAPAVKRRYGAFAAEPPGFFHADVKHLTRLKGRRSYVFVLIDRATRYVFAEVLSDLKTETAAGFLRRAVRAFPFSGRVLLTDNGFEWTDRCAGRRRTPSGRHAVDVACAALGLEHRLTRIRRPQTNGMVERFNRRLSEGLSRAAKIKENSGRNCFATHKARDAFVANLVRNYNHTRQVRLNHRSPAEMLRENGDNDAKPNTKESRWRRISSTAHGAREFNRPLRAPSIRRLIPISNLI